MMKYLPKVLTLLMFFRISYATKRTKLDAFTITLRPFQDVLSAEQVTAVRDNVETVLSGYLFDYDWTPGTSVTYVGLARVLENTLSDDAVQIKMDGLVYFGDNSTSIPSSADMNPLILEALSPEALGEALNPVLVGLITAVLDVDMPSEAPTMAPSSEPQEDSAASILQSAPKQSKSPSTGSLVGMVLSGTAIVIVVIVLLTLHLRRSKVMTAEWETEHVQQKQAPSPTKTEATTTHDDNDEDLESNGVIPTSRLGNLFTTGRLQTQMMEDDLSELDFNVDDLVSDFDDTVSIRPHIIAVEPVESFEHARTHVLKKDMLDTSTGIVKYGHGANDKTHPCALEPTDVSAATLAVKTQSSNSRSNSTLIPKVSWWAQQPRDEIESIDDTTDFAGGDWDPDDHSLSTDAQSIGFTATVENKDEQSLLHHSLRNESYKLQRLRTPENMAIGYDDHSSSNDGFDSTLILS